MQISGQLSYKCGGGLSHIPLLKARLKEKQDAGGGRRCVGLGTQYASMQRGEWVKLVKA